MSQPLTFAKALDKAHSHIHTFSDTAKLDAQLILAHTTGKSRTWVLAHPEECLSEEEADHFHTLVHERRRGVPLPYLLGWWEFYGRRFRVTPQVLIPRPESELLVVSALKYLTEYPERRRVVDIGTGSGCLAVTLAAEINQLEVFATDISMEAMQVAKENAREFRVLPQIRFVQLDLAKGLSGPFDLICANLPYIPSKELKALDVGKWEPALALDGGVDGIQYIQRLLDDLPGLISEGGLILFEVHSQHAKDVLELAKLRFPNADHHIEQDLAGRDRVISISLMTGK